MAIAWKVEKTEVSSLAKCLMEDIEDDLSLGESGKVSTRMGNYQFLADSLFGLIEHKFPLESSVLYKIFEESIRECFAQSESLSDEKILLKIFGLKCEKLLRSKKDFVLLTSVNISLKENPKPRNIDGCQISFYKKIPIKYRESRLNLITTVKNKLDIYSENEGYQFVVIKICAADAMTAYSNAMNAFDIYRGLCQVNIQKNLGFLASSARQMYNSDCRLKMGNIHTLHLPDGSQAMKAYWIEDVANFSEPRNMNDFPEIDRRVGKVLSKFNKFDKEYRDVCVKALTGYVSAISKEDQESRFLSLWLCLELLTGADSADNIIKRICFFYEDREFHVATLLALRRARNSHVHAGISPLNIEIKNFRLVTFVERMLVRFLSNNFRFSTPRQFFDFVSLNTDVEVINDQISKLKLVKKFIGH